MLTLKDLMSRNIQWAAPEDPISDVAKKMDVFNVSDLPVCEGGKVVGILTRTRISFLKRSPSVKASPIRASEAMVREVTCGDEALDVKAAIRIMREKKLRSMPVVDSTNRLIGIFQLGM